MRRDCPPRILVLPQERRFHLDAGEVLAVLLQVGHHGFLGHVVLDHIGDVGIRLGPLAVAQHLGKRDVQQFRKGGHLLVELATVWIG